MLKDGGLGSKTLFRGALSTGEELTGALMGK